MALRCGDRGQIRIRGPDGATVVDGHRQPTGNRSGKGHRSPADGCHLRAGRLDDVDAPVSAVQPDRCIDPDDLGRRGETKTKAQHRNREERCNQRKDEQCVHNTPHHRSDPIVSHRTDTNHPSGRGREISGNRRTETEDRPRSVLVPRGVCRARPDAAPMA